MSLAFKKAIITSNIKVGFRKSGIWALDFQAMQNKTGFSEEFIPRSESEVAQEEEDIAKMIERGLFIFTKFTCFFVDNEDVETSKKKI